MIGHKNTDSSLLSTKQVWLISQNKRYINSLRNLTCCSLAIMACPFIDEVVNEGAVIMRRALQRERTFRDRSDPLAYPDNHLYERHRFSRERIQYICRLLHPYISNSTCRNKALTVPQTVCIALCFFASGTFLYTVGKYWLSDCLPLCKSNLHSFKETAEHLHHLPWSQRSSYH